jgi:hypothetical protein
VLSSATVNQHFSQALRSVSTKALQRSLPDHLDFDGALRASLASSTHLGLFVEAVVGILCGSDCPLKRYRFQLQASCIRSLGRIILIWHFEILRRVPLEHSHGAKPEVCHQISLLRTTA